jgi:hypothetical protein
MPEATINTEADSPPLTMRAPATEGVGTPMRPPPRVIGAAHEAKKPSLSSNVHDVRSGDIVAYLEQKLAEADATIAAQAQVIEMFMAGADALSAIAAKLRGDKPTGGPS